MSQVKPMTVLLSYYMYEKLRDIISYNSVPANNFPVVFPSKPHKEKYRKPKLVKSKATFLSAFVFENIL